MDPKNHLESIISKTRIGSLRLNSRVYELLWFNGGTNIIELDWDNLIILDGCRFDIFNSIMKNDNDLNGKLRSVISTSSSSGEFINKNINTQNLNDTIYITSNPHVHNVDRDVFYGIIDLINNDDYWDATKKVVLPSTMTKQAIKFYNNYPDKRFIVHFMQPHYPFLGPTGEKIDQNRGIYGKRSENTEIRSSIWKNTLRKPFCDIDTIWKAYRENLLLALNQAKRINRQIPGKTIISSDHGNLIGDRLLPIPLRSFGHPQNTYVPPLVRVPWYEFEFNARRNVTSEPPNDDLNNNNQTPDERLEALGYL